MPEILTKKDYISNEEERWRERMKGEWDGSGVETDGEREKWAMGRERGRQEDREKET